MLVLPLPCLALHVYDPGDVVHALGHGRPVLLRAVVHVQQPGQREYVRARYAYRRQLGQLLVPRVRRDGCAERVESRADRVHPGPLARVGLDPSGPGHVLAVPGGRGARRGAPVVLGGGGGGGCGGGGARRGAGGGRCAAALVRGSRAAAAQLGGSFLVGHGHRVRWRSGPCRDRSALGQVQWLRFGRWRRRRRRLSAPLRQRQYPVHVPYVVEQPQAHVRRRLVAAPRPERWTRSHVHRQHGLGGCGRGRGRRVGSARLGRTPVPVIRVVVRRPSPLVRPPAVAVAVSAHRGRHVNARIFALVRGRRVRFPLDRGRGHHVRAARRRRSVVRVMFSGICKTIEKPTLQSHNIYCSDFTCVIMPHM